MKIGSDALAWARRYRAEFAPTRAPAPSEVLRLAVAGPWLAPLPGSSLRCDARIIPDVEYLLAHFGLRATSCFRNDGPDDHGEHALGLALDAVPSDGDWSRALAAAQAFGWLAACGTTGCAGRLRPPMRFIGYNGYPGHGDPAHASAHAFALNGIRREREYWEARLAAPEHPGTTADSTVWISDKHPNAPGSLTYSRFRLGDLPDVLGEGGAVMAQISQQWAVAVVTAWDQEYRRRITEAIGVAEPLRLSPFGDLRRFRNDIVPHQGVATERNTGRCEVFKHWFHRGDVLYFDQAKVAEFMTSLEIAIQTPRTP